ncbi:MAG TPA: ATP-binding cassette domain-containing protein [Solirubrobacteraceae bacterium]|nr:ATP-binding cassette domain-containing protein [Solirubrobacteraceae bacterium]
MSGLCFDDVSYRYPGAQEPALRGVSLAVAPGEFCVVAGASASGKSTLLRAACGLVPHFHGGEFAGRVTVGGLDTRSHGPERLGAVVGTLLQDPETQVVMGSVRAELAFPLQNRGQAPNAVARGVEEVALALGIGSLLDRRIDELSGGELQRVALGAALGGRPTVVVLDEPTSQLDPVAGDELLSLLRRLNEEWETTVLLIEHRLERCLAAADRVVAMGDGTVVFDGLPADFQSWAGRSAPALQTPAAALTEALGLRPPPTGVKQARALLRAHHLLDAAGPKPTPSLASPTAFGVRARVRARRRSPPSEVALKMRGLWYEIADGPAILRGLDLELAAGERVALLGRNGAGKSTLLRLARGLVEPTRGRVQAPGHVALLMQNPGDYFLHERVADEAPPGALARGGLDGLQDRHPRDLSGGQRQRLALAIVTGDPLSSPAATVVALDEPTRGMDRSDKGLLADHLRALAGAGCAVIVATHDPEFAAAFAARALIMAEGRLVADGPVRELLSGGWYFATETARVLGGAGGALTPEDGAQLLRAGRTVQAAS